MLDITFIVSLLMMIVRLIWEWILKIRADL